MDTTGIERLLKEFEQPLVKQALADLRAAVPVRGDLDLGDEYLMVCQSESDELVFAGVRVERDDTRNEFDVTPTEAQRRAAELLWAIGLGNAAQVEQAIADPVARLEFLSTQADQTALRLGLRLNEDEGDHLSIYPGPLPKP